jgi:hypothetical protein
VLVVDSSAVLAALIARDPAPGLVEASGTTAISTDLT